VGVLILARSYNELNVEKDYDMAIVLAAMAFECELSRLYRKWKEVEAPNTGTFDLEKSEEELRKMGSVAEKITNVSTFLCAGGIEAFVESSDKWKKTIGEGFSSLHQGSLAADFQRAVFWPRNKVLHHGTASHTRDEAARCCSIAWLGLHILKEMDKAKLAVFEGH
jgi:predicted transcriptional regulator